MKNSERASHSTSLRFDFAGSPSTALCCAETARSHCYDSYPVNTDDGTLHCNQGRNSRSALIGSMTGRLWKKPFIIRNRRQIGMKGQCLEARKTTGLPMTRLLSPSGCLLSATRDPVCENALFCRRSALAMCPALMDASDRIYFPMSFQCIRGQSKSKSSF